MAGSLKLQTGVIADCIVTLMRQTLGGLGCHPFKGGGSVVVDILFYAPPIV